MNWYTTKLVFQIKSNSLENKEFEEQLRLIKATNEQQAMQKAIEMGQKEETVFDAAQGRKVKWEFAGVSSLQKIKELEHGAELFSQIQSTDDDLSFKQTIKQKNLYLNSRINYSFSTLETALGLS